MLDKDFEIRTKRLVLRFLTESDYELWKSANLATLVTLKLKKHLVRYFKTLLKNGVCFA